MRLPEYTSFAEKNRFFETNPKLVGVSNVINTEAEFNAMLKHITNFQNEITQKREEIKERFRQSDLFKNDTDAQHQNRFITLGLENGLFFRGVSQAKYKIFSSAQRYWLENHLKIKGKSFVDFVEELLIHVEKNKLLQDYYSALRVHANDLLYMSLLQHYGQCSPLIDISYDVKTALFFAMNYTKEEEHKCELDDYCSLYVFNTYGNQYWANLDVIFQNGQENAIKDLEDASYPIEMIDTSNIDRADLYASWVNHNNNGRGLHDWKLALVKLPTAHGTIIPQTRIGQHICWTNLNLLAQQGGFFLYTIDDISLEEYILNTKELPNIICYNINKRLKDYVLRNIPLTEADIYPRMKDIINNEIAAYKTFLP